MNNCQDDPANTPDIIKQIINDALYPFPNGIFGNISQKLAQMYPQKAWVKGHDPAFNVEAFARVGHCTMLPSVQTHNQRDTGWGRNNKPYQTMNNGLIQIRWEDYQLDVVLVSCGNTRYYWILADTEKVAGNFYGAVCKWNCEIRSDEILVFQNGFLSKDPELLKAIKGTTFDDLTLEKTLKQEIQDELSEFFELRKIYEELELRVPWKRGLLFTGSPGNGKTHTIRAIINRMQTQLRCLYVKGFDSSDSISQDGIYHVFQAARRYAPCLLILEDLDSLVNEQNRSSFLNEVDGFGSNSGVLIIATSNYPERLDPAVKRMGRFDKILEFKLPGLTERIDYLQYLNKAELPQLMRLSDTEIPQIAELTEGLSFVNLRELFTSSTKKSVKARTLEEVGQIMISQIPVLKQQISLSKERETSNKGNVKQFISLFEKLNLLE